MFFINKLLESLVLSNSNKIKIIPRQNHHNKFPAM